MAPRGDLALRNAPTGVFVDPGLDNRRPTRYESPHDISCYDIYQEDAMHRSLRAAALITALATALAAPGVLARDAGHSFEGHPFVGAWLVDTNTDDITEPPSRLIVHPDGTLLQVNHSEVAIGVWEPTGDDAAALTITAQIDAGDGQVAIAIVRGAVTLDASGAAWTAAATSEWIDPAGETSGQIGPIPAAATRIVVEPMAPTASPGA
jgi:hypothetical protein